MTEVIPKDFADFVIYTSALEHMHPEDGRKSLEESYKIMKKGATMFLSCPNTEGNGYNTQYRAHVYEWGYDELKKTVLGLGFRIKQEVGLVMGAKEMDSFYASQPEEIQKFYRSIKQYLPNAFLSVLMAF